MNKSDKLFTFAAAELCKNVNENKSNNLQILFDQFQLNTSQRRDI